MTFLCIIRNSPSRLPFSWQFPAVLLSALIKSKYCITFSADIAILDMMHSQVPHWSFWESPWNYHVSMHPGSFLQILSIREASSQHPLSIEASLNHTVNILKALLTPLAVSLMSPWTLFGALKLLPVSILKHPWSILRRYHRLILKACLRKSPDYVYNQVKAKLILFP